jgi:phage-related protein
MAEYEVFYYQTLRGDCPVNEFIGCLPVKIRAKLQKWFQKLEEHGPNLPRPYADVVHGKIRELRLVFASNHYRFLYFFEGKKVILTHGFLKKSDKVPREEIDRAEKFKIDFENRLRKGEIEL